MTAADTMERVAGPEPTTSAKIRALGAAGYARADIARFLGKRYQHVRNVLEAGAPKPAAPNPLSREPALEPAEEPIQIGNLFRMNVQADGSVRLPSAVLEAFRLRPGRPIVGVLDGELFTLMSQTESVRRARAMIPQWKPGEPLWSEELIAERRREAEREARGE